MWPILNVTLPLGKTTVNCVLIIVSPNSASINEAFTGLLILPNNTSYVVTGFLGSSTVYIVSIEKLTTQTLNNANNPYSGLIAQYITNKRTLINSTINTSNTSGSLTRTTNNNINKAGSIVNSNVKNPGYLLPIIIVTTILIISTSLLLIVNSRRRMEYPKCLEDGLVKIIKKAKIRQPGLTHRELGNYLIDRIGNKYVIEEVIRMFEEGVYGGKEVDCKRYLSLISEVLRKL
ncbi:MAG: hypothetical protein ACP5NQ_03790, partial [Vulcanisaeta sp.]